MHLLSENGSKLSKQEAYRIALIEFYKRAAQLEDENEQFKNTKLEEIKTSEVEYDEDGKPVELTVELDLMKYTKPWTSHFMKQEEAEAAESVAFAAEKNAQ
jgi:hypothetical protein